MVRHIQTKNADNDATYEYLFNHCFSSMNPVHSGYGLIHCSWSRPGISCGALPVLLQRTADRGFLYLSQYGKMRTIGNMFV
jgi:hypothetical protein